MSTATDERDECLAAITEILTIFDDDPQMTEDILAAAAAGQDTAESAALVKVREIGRCVMEGRWPASGSATTGAADSALPPPVADFGPVRLELMGHRYREGHLSEVVIAGQPFLRLDLKGGAGVEFYRPDAVYCITPGMTPPTAPRAEIPSQFARNAWDGDDEEGGPF